MVVYAELELENEEVPVCTSSLSLLPKIATTFLVMPLLVMTLFAYNLTTFFSHRHPSSLCIILLLCNFSESRSAFAIWHRYGVSRKRRCGMVWSRLTRYWYVIPAHFQPSVYVPIDPSSPLWVTYCIFIDSLTNGMIMPAFIWTFICCTVIVDVTLLRRMLYSFSSDSPLYSAGYSPCVASLAGVPPAGLGPSGLVHEEAHPTMSKTI